MGDAGLDFQAEALQVPGDQFGGLVLAVGEFGVLVDVPPPSDHLLGHRIGALVDRCPQVAARRARRQR